MNRLLLFFLFTPFLLQGCGKDKPGEQPPGDEYSLEVFPDNLLFIFKGGDFTFKVVSDTDWSVSTDADWCRPENSFGTGDWGIKVLIDENPGYEPRTAVFTIDYGKDQKAFFTIDQMRRPDPFISTDPESLEYFRPGGIMTVRVKSNVEWAVEATAEWLSLDVAKAYQDAEINVTADSYQGTGNRECQLVFTGETAVVSLRVIQSPVDPDIVVFEDAVFKAYCLENWDLDGDGEISVFEAAQAREIHVFSKGISSLEGIEHFTGITELACASNNISRLDLTANTSLVNLWCEGNRITSLVLGRNEALERVYCSGNQLTEVDISQCPNLLSITADVNPLASLDCSLNSKITYINVGDTDITSLDLSSNPELYNLSCSWTSVSTLDLSANPKIGILNVTETGMTEVDLSGMPDLFRFTCAACDFRQIDISANKKLNYMDCTMNHNLSVIYVWEGFDLDKVSFLCPPGVEFRVR